MSATKPSTFVQWYKNLPIPWLAGETNGQAEGNAWPAVVDAQVDLLRAAVKARMPDYAPSDALAHIGGDRGLIQGPLETDANFIIRLKTAWDDWARAGTWLELLVQLYWGGWTNAVIVQQNGLAYYLTGTPVAGVDPTSVVDFGTFRNIETPFTSSVTGGPTIPVSNPWWVFDSDTAFASRFAILFPGPLPTYFATWGTATFTGVEDGSVAHPWPTVTWNNVFADTAYDVLVGPAITTGGPVVVAADGNTQTTTGVQITASASFTGTVDVIAYVAGTNPFASLSANNLSLLRTILNRWRPARATCVGIYALVQGRFWGWPLGLWGDGYWGPSSTVSYTP